MTRVPFVGGNWKMNLNRAQSVELAKAVARGAAELPIDVGIAPSFVYLDAVNQALRSPDLRERMAALGMEPAPTTPEQFDQLIRSEIDKWSKVVKASGMKLD